MRHNNADDNGTDTKPSRRNVLRMLGGSMAVGTASGLAGCPDQGLTSASATPAVLYPEGQKVLGLSAFQIDELTRTVSAADVGEVTLTSYLAVHGRPKEHEQSLAARFGVPEPGAHALGILAMPAPDPLGRDLNPLAEKPLEEVLVDDRGREFLSQTDAVDTPEFEWARGPNRVTTREIELLGTATSAESYLGVADDGETSRTVLTTLARIDHEGDVIVVGETRWRRTPSEPLDADKKCVDNFCQVPRGFLERMLDQIRWDTIGICPGLAMNLGTNVADVCSRESSDQKSPTPTFGITDARVVQQVEKTQVEGTGSPVRVYHQEQPNPPLLVRGENSAVVFEFDTLQNLNAMSQPLRVGIFSGKSGSNAKYEREGTIEFSKTDLQRIKNGNEHTIATLHRLSNGSSSNQNPVFELETGEVKIEPVRSGSTDTSGVSETVSVPSNRIQNMDTLKVGFVVLRDNPPLIRGPGDRYGNNNGMPRAPRRTFESASEYLQRAYPGDVATYLLDPSRPYLAHGVKTLGVPNDMQQAAMHLEKQVVIRSNNPTNIGQLRYNGPNRGKIISQINGSGVDVTVAIVPGIAPNNSNASGYYDFHFGHLGLSGVAGMAFLPTMAVSIRGASPGGNDQQVSQTTAQEVGHYWQDYLADNYLNPGARHPMAQRRNGPNPFQAGPAPSGPNNVQRTLDKLHARHQDSNNQGISGRDDPGVVSTAYDLQGGFANLQHFTNPNGSFSVDGPGWRSTPTSSIEGVESYMSYTGRAEQTWADERIHNRLIQRGSSGWGVPNTSGLGKKIFVLAANGAVTDEGAVQYEEVNALQGIDEYPDNEEFPVEVALQGPDGEVLVNASVRARLPMTHAHGDLPRLPSFKLPFKKKGVRVRTVYDGTTTFMNPIVRSVRDAVERVPERGFADDPKTAQETINEALAEVASLMEESAYGEAATVMNEDVGTRIRNAMADYDAGLGQRTVSSMMTLVGRMVERLSAAE